MTADLNDKFATGPSRNDMRKNEEGGPAPASSESVDFARIASKFRSLVTAASALSDGLDDANSQVSTAERFQSQIFGMSKDLSVLCRELRGSPIPKPGDPVCGSLHVESDDNVLLWFRLYGEVSEAPEGGNACVTFFSFEAMDNCPGDGKVFVAKYLNVDLERHAADMRWDKGDEEWNIDL